MRKIFMLLFVPFLCIASLAQGGHYTTTVQYTFDNNLSNCRVTNCFIETSTGAAGATVQLIMVSTGFDGSVYGIDAPGYIYKLPLAGTSKSVWSKLTTLGAGWKYIAVRKINEIYATKPYTGCGNGVPEAYYWNGSTWTIKNKCIGSIFITSDDTLVGINYVNGGTIYYTTNPQAATSTWNTFTGNGWSQVAPVNSTNGFATQGTTLYQLNFANNSYSVMVGAPLVNHLAATADNLIFVTSTTAGTNGNVYYYNAADNPASWVNTPGTLTGIFGSSSLYMFGINGSTPYHFLGVSLGADVNIHGYYDCSVFTSGCPINSYHTATAKAGFPSGYHYGAAASSSGSPATTLDATAHDTSRYCDPFFGDPNSPYCIIQLVNGNVDCSEMGSIFSSSGGGLIPRWEMAATRVIYLGTYSACTTNQLGSTKCAWNVANWCTPSTTPPDNDYTGQAIKDYQPHAYWDAVNPCINWGTGWMCAPFGVATPNDTQAPKASCTRN